MIFKNIVKKISNKLPETVKSNKIYDQLRNWYHHKSCDIYIISFPKCGRTWLRLLIGKSIVEKFKLEDVEKNEILELYPLASYRKDIPKIRVSHDDDPQWKKPEEIEESKTKYKNKKVIFLVRDPRDVLVSSYFQRKKRKNKFNGTLSEYLYSQKGSVESIIKFYNIWFENRHIPEDFLLVRYEDMHEDTGRELKRVLDFIGFENVESSIIDHAVSYASFDNMREMEKENKFNSNRLKPGEKNDEESYKTRKGQVGGYVSYFGSSEIKFIDRKIDNSLLDYFNY